jgi:hypothetical protein
MRTRIPTQPLLAAAIAALAALFCMALAARPAAAAAAACQFDATTAKVTVGYSGPGTVARIKRGPSGEILVDGAACGAATVTNTDTILAQAGSGRQQLIIDLSGGSFSPGKTPESGSISEIEFQVDAGNGGEYPLGDDVTVSGRSVADTIRFGGTGIFLDGDVDPDVTTTNVETLTALGNGGDDHLLGTGDGAGGPAASLPLLLSGGAGNDELVGGDVKDTLDGGDGNDTELGGGDADTIKEGTAPNGADVLDGGASPYDRIEYAARTTGVRIDMNGNADDGAPGEGDNVKDTSEYLVGGAGDDTGTWDDGDSRTDLP